MKIIYIKLVGFKRFPILESTTFEHHFSSKITQISGCNGSGKTSLVNELTPLPSDKSSFDKNGYKEIHIEKDKSLYKLISDFRDGVKYSFIVDGEELNVANLVTAQRELVYEHFRITKLTHDLQVGVESFTNMSTVSRKKLFSAITHTNIDTVINGYNQLKEQLRTNELLLKTKSIAYQTEEAKLTDSHRYATILDTISRTRTHIEDLLVTRGEISKYSSTTSDTVYDDYMGLKAAISDLYDKYYIYLVSYPKDDLERIKLKHTTELSLLDYQLKEIYSTIEVKQDNRRNMELLKGNDLATLQTQYDETISKINSHLNTLQYLTKDSDTIEVQSAIMSLDTTMPDICSSIALNPKVNDSRLYTRDRYDNLMLENSTLLEKLTKLTTEELSIVKITEDYKDKTATCPSCSHRWPLTAAMQSSCDHTTDLSSILEQKQDIRLKLERIDKELSSIREYFTLYKSYSTLRSSTLNALKGVWLEIDNNEYIFNDPIKIPKLINSCALDVYSLLEVQSLKLSANDIGKRIELLKNTPMDVDLEAEIDSLVLELRVIQERRDECNATLSNILLAEKIYIQLEKYNVQLDKGTKTLQSHNLSKLSNNLLNIVNTELTKQKVLLLEAERELNQHDSIQYTLGQYRTDLEATKENIRVLDIVLNELSPKNGLIAKSVSSFLNLIVQHVNATIASVWEYKMVLKPIDVETDSLDYKFKVEVEDKLTVPDVSKASRGMRESIDLAFKLVLYRLLALDHYPIIFDELAANMDSVHTNNISKLIQTLANSERFSQLFIITHKENMSFLRDVDVIELS